MAEITFRGVGKSYGGAPVLSGIDANIAKGELLVVVGPSGCGKSTLLRMVAGLEKITSGDILIDGERVNDLEPSERDIAMVFQNYALYPHMSVAQNMSYGLKIRGVARAEIARRVRETAEMLEIAPYLKRKPRELSGGQRQRVAMGRAIVREPIAFLFDEPLSNLDAKLRTQMRLEIKRLQKRLGLTTIYVTHDQVEAMTLGDRLMILNDGAIEQFDTPLAAYERPATRFVAGFIGSPAMNFLDATAAEGRVRLGNGAEFPIASAHSGPAVLGLRPEHARPDPDGPLRLKVEMVERLGAASVAHGRLVPGDAPFALSLSQAPQLAGDDLLGFSYPPEAAHLFDPQSGRRL